MTLVQIHVALSLIGIFTGLVVTYGLLTARLFRIWTGVFLATTILTSLTGFLLPPFGLDPARAVGVISLVLLAVAVAGLYGFHLFGAWRWIYSITATAALYLNVFVGVTQAFQKIGPLQRLAPTQSEAAFVIAQLAVLGVFVALGVLTAVTFRPRVQQS